MLSKSFIRLSVPWRCKVGRCGRSVYHMFISSFAHLPFALLPSSLLPSSLYPRASDSWSIAAMATWNAIGKWLFPSWVLCCGHPNSVWHNADRLAPPPNDERYESIEYPSLNVLMNVADINETTIPRLGGLSGASLPENDAGESPSNRDHQATDEWNRNSPPKRGRSRTPPRRMYGTQQPSSYWG